MLPKELRVTRQYLHDASAGVLRRMREFDLTVQTPRAHQRGIQSVRAVRRSNHLSQVYVYY
jgi:hypothetical protein